MGIGIFLIIVGAILAFAVRADTDVVDVQVMGLILIAGGIATIYYARTRAAAERRVTTIDDRRDPGRVVRTVHEQLAEQEPRDDLRRPQP